MNTLMLGLVAGSAGKAALDLVTYADMLVRGRPASTVPAKVMQNVAGAAGEGAERALEAAPIEAQGIEQAPSSQAGADGEGEDEQPGPRASAAGAVSGYVIGLGLGAGYALVRSRMGAMPAWAPWMAGAALSAAAMAGSDVPAVATGATSDPRGWSGTAWLSDILPHAAYGFVTAMTVEALSSPSPVQELARAIRIQR